MAQFIGFRCQETEVLNPDTSYEITLPKFLLRSDWTLAARRRPYETLSVLNTEKIERRTSNAQHRTFNIDGAALYLL